MIEPKDSGRLQMEFHKFLNIKQIDKLQLALNIKKCIVNPRDESKEGGRGSQLANRVTTNSQIDLYIKQIIITKRFQKFTTPNMALLKVSCAVVKDSLLVL